jgi:SAM-dependent methyltransferase
LITRNTEETAHVQRRVSAKFDFLKTEGALRLADRLELVRRDFPLCLDFGCHDGLLTNHLKQTGKVETVIQADPTFEFAKTARVNGPAIVSEAEQLPFAPAMFDAVFSCLSLHWIDDLPGLLTQMRALLKPDGLLLVSFLGGSTLNELRTSFRRSGKRDSRRDQPAFGVDGRHSRCWWVAWPGGPCFACCRC